MMKPGIMERSLKITRQRTTPIKAIADVAINNRRTGNRSHNMMRKLRERKTLPKPFAAAPAIHLAFVTPLSSSLEAAPPPGRIGTTLLLVGLRVLLLNPLNVLITIPFLYKSHTPMIGQNGLPFKEYSTIFRAYEGKSTLPLSSIWCILIIERHYFDKK